MEKNPKYELKFIEHLLKAIAASSVRKLNLHMHSSQDFIATIESWFIKVTLYLV